MTKRTPFAKRLYADLTDNEVSRMLMRPIPTGLCEHKWRTGNGEHEHTCRRQMQHEKKAQRHLCLCRAIPL